ncbi:LysM peptidoglycan-binding domain-containing protein [Actinotalea sp. M2MS4P-6]|uniref:LysM peptidoglycan-binding domain-containing protein n=1 Tax=Actinotalea sp. M2MS4P-6 TaxID=2983762 RepID=UPI0021E3B735|nr:LysM peptidoglycan-binding domain-containing protein [Actinotalea sp. M2MS4P-6]MCV2396470.1 LysM peptidoglycan-binding domain-containing protein [Actinotalea sp. M2MS4P-6]
MSSQPRSALGTTALRRATGGVGLALVAATVVTAQPAQAKDHVVEPGDTVSHLALRYGTTVKAIVAANRLDSRAFIRVGQTLAIPTASDATTGTASRTTSTPTATTTRYTVVSGDTVSHIAARYGTTVQAIVAANGLDSRAFIRIGQTLTIPTSTGGTTGAASASASTTSSATSTTTYTVASGDTVSHIAARYGTTVQAIVAANGLDSRAFIRIGQTLTIPTSTGGTTVTSGLVGSTFEGRTYPAATVASANQNKATLLAIGVPSRSEMRALVEQTARDMGVDPALALAVAYQESGFNQAAVSPANAIGVMQVIPSSGEWASDLVGRDLNLLDPQDNVVAGVAILRALTSATDDTSTAIAGYYQGLASVRRNGMFADTRRYVASVRTLMSRFA